VKTINFEDGEDFFNSEKKISEDKYKINPEYSFLLDALKRNSKIALPKE